MKHTPHRLLAGAAGLLAAVVLSAQSAPASGPISQPAGKGVTTAAVTNAATEETLVLSPFTVNSEKDTGYQATNTLAGTRLNTPIKDLGASISVTASKNVRS